MRPLRLGIVGTGRFASFHASRTSQAIKVPNASPNVMESAVMTPWIVAVRGNNVGYSETHPHHAASNHAKDPTGLRIASRQRSDLSEDSVTVVEFSADARFAISQR